MSIKNDLSAVVAVSAAVAILGGAAHAMQPKKPSGLVATIMAQNDQEAKPKEFDMLWKQKDDRYIIKKPYSDGIILEQQVATGDPNYKAVLTYTGKVGKDNQLSEWEVVAVVYATSDSSKPDSVLRRAGRVDSSGKFVLDDAKPELAGNRYNDAMTALTSSVLTAVQNGTPELVKYWVADTTRKYETLKAGQTLGPLPK